MGRPATALVGSVWGWGCYGGPDSIVRVQKARMQDLLGGCSGAAGGAKRRNSAKFGKIRLSEMNIS